MPFGNNLITGPSCDQYPMNAVCATQYTYEDFGFNADDACQPTYWRFSAVGTIGTSSGESLLTSTDITVGAPSFDDDGPKSHAVTTVSQRTGGSASSHS